jgi:hypothetical protein
MGHDLPDRPTARELSPAGRAAHPVAASILAPSSSPPPAEVGGQESPDASGLESPAEAGVPAEAEPLEGSVRLSGLRTARVVVPMDDGSVVRARINVRDDVVDVALRASAETGLAADQRVGELREALARQGLELRNFDVAADAGDGPTVGSSDARGGRDSPSPGPPPSDRDPLPSGPSIEPVPTPYATADDLGRGALISRRF